MFARAGITFNGRLLVSPCLYLTHLERHTGWRAALARSSPAVRPGPDLMRCGYGTVHSLWRSAGAFADAGRPDRRNRAGLARLNGWTRSASCLTIRLSRAAGRRVRGDSGVPCWYSAGRAPISFPSAPDEPDPHAWRRIAGARLGERRHRKPWADHGDRALGWRCRPFAARHRQPGAASSRRLSRTSYRHFRAASAGRGALGFYHGRRSRDLGAAFTIRWQAGNRAAHSLKTKAGPRA
jgi:hypothetical protein